MPRKREGPRGPRGDHVYPHFHLTLSPPTKTCVACLIPHFSPINIYIQHRHYRHRESNVSAHTSVCMCVCICKWFCCSWWRVHSDGRRSLIVQERERVKEGVVCAIGGSRRVVGREGGVVVRVRDARGSVLAATRVMKRDLSEERSRGRRER